MSKQKIDGFFALALEVVSDWILMHPAVRIDIMIPAVPRTGFEVGMRVAENNGRITCHVRTRDAPGVMLGKLDKTLARVRQGVKNKGDEPVLDRPVARTGTVH